MSKTQKEKVTAILEKNPDMTHAEINKRFKSLNVSSSVFYKVRAEIKKPAKNDTKSKITKAQRVRNELKKNPDMTHKQFCEKFPDVGMTPGTFSVVKRKVNKAGTSGNPYTPPGASSIIVDAELGAVVVALKNVGLEPTITVGGVTIQV